ncbi:flavin reductase (DIM6/NTAB) family NADH-FMN oxidoreductase RutF [Rhizobium rosettiformans]|uniref:Flavin reductase family protein n=2 Tax=Rhizobium rosettiformans TaxID=1368430 RepID=A0A4V4HR14_9HYPH|nr:flavin reductase family protein [Rhizobium rosettiformans]MBB5276420.1 flavin reductase (DIM6/NTAB) family NADH-FMN oxidoreductase RutF [Rhizobium rosettiformans]THV35966.1 flavin reductase family protein [Rhizobium rosettiformans W3]
MFYDTESNAHGMAHDPFKAIVAPRPIGWIGTKGRDGSRNLSPYSFFNAVGDKPKMVMFSSSGRKDSLRNVQETGVFTASFVSRSLLDQMNASSAAVSYETDEFTLAGLTAAAGKLVDAPYVGEAVAALECCVTKVLTLPDMDGNETDSHAVFGQVVGIHIADAMIRGGRFDLASADPIMRLGYMDYAGMGPVFELKRPSQRG